MPHPRIERLAAAFETKQQEFLVVDKLARAFYVLSTKGLTSEEQNEAHAVYEAAWHELLEAAKANGRIPPTTPVMVKV